MTTPSRAALLAVSIAWGLMAAVGGYAIMRVLQVLLGHEPDPAHMVWTPHSAFFWRSLSVLYGGGLASFVAGLLSKARWNESTRMLSLAIWLVAALVALQVSFFP